MKIQSKKGKRSDLGMYFRSTWEANYARYLVWLKENGQIKEWKYEDKEWEFPVKRGNRFYKCDFHIWENDGSEVFHEIKGWMDKNSAVKLNRMAKYYPDVKIVIVDGKQMAALNKQMKSLIKEWE